MSSCDISLLLVSEQPAGLRRLRVEQVESVCVTFTETERWWNVCVAVGHLRGFRPRSDGTTGSRSWRGSCNEQWRLVTQRACDAVLHRVTGPRRPLVSHCCVIMFSSQLVSVQVRWKLVGDIKFVISTPKAAAALWTGRWWKMKSCRRHRGQKQQNHSVPQHQRVRQSHNLLQHQLQVKHTEVNRVHEKESSRKQPTAGRVGGRRFKCQCF